MSVKVTLSYLEVAKGFSWLGWRPAVGRVAAARQSARSESRKERLQRWLAMDKDRVTRDDGDDAAAEGESVREGCGTVRPEPSGVSKQGARAMVQEPDEDQTEGGTTSGSTQVEAWDARAVTSSSPRSQPDLSTTTPGPVDSPVRAGGSWSPEGYTGAWVWTRWGGFQDG